MCKYKTERYSRRVSGPRATQKKGVKNSAGLGTQSRVHLEIPQEEYLMSGCPAPLRAQPHTQSWALPPAAPCLPLAGAIKGLRSATPGEKATRSGLV